MDALIILSRFIQFAALAVLFGGSLFRLCVAPQQPNRERSRPPPIIDISAAMAALLSALGWLIGVAATMTGAWAELLVPDTMAAVLLDTQFGRIWIGRLMLAAGILVLALAGRHSRARDITMLLMSATLSASLASVGHGSAGGGMLGPIHFASDVIHLLCAAAWLGGLVALAFALHRAIKLDEDSFDFVRTAVPAFSRLGYVAVGLLVVSGTLNAIVLVPRPELLITTAYGRVLLVKISLVAVMLAIAGLNRFILTPKLVHASGRAYEATAALYRSVAVEQVVGLFVLASVAVLGTIHPSH